VDVSIKYFKEYCHRKFNKRQRTIFSCKTASGKIAILIVLKQSTLDQAEDGLSDFSESLSNFIQYSRFRLVNTLKYGDIFNASSIVSSIEFDRDDEYFATAGVTKKIKIFDFGNIERLIVNSTFGYSSIRDGGRRASDMVTHYPIKELTCRSKIR
jgi:hypothetical protein